MNVVWGEWIGGGGAHTGCRCESEEGGEGEGKSSGEHGACLLGW